MNGSYLLYATDGCYRPRLCDAFVGTLLCWNSAPHDITVCGSCPACRLFGKSSHRLTDHLRVVDRDGDRSSISLEAVTTALHWLDLASPGSQTKVLYLRDSDALHWRAYHTLLKALEEPPRHSCVVLSVRNKRSLPLPLRSRCQQMAIDSPIHQGKLRDIAATLPGNPAPLVNPPALLAVLTELAVISEPDHELDSHIATTKQVLAHLQSCWIPRAQRGRREAITDFSPKQLPLVAELVSAFGRACLRYRLSRATSPNETIAALQESCPLSNESLWRATDKAQQLLSWIREGVHFTTINQVSSMLSLMMGDAHQER